jgi:TldD protein
MATLRLPPGMADLRPELGELVATVEKSLPYGAVLLSSREGLRITVDSREERLAEWPPTAGAIVTAFDGATLHERAVGGFSRDDLHQAADELASIVPNHGRQTIDPGPEQSADFATDMSIAPDSLTAQQKLDRCRELQMRLRGMDSRIVNVQVAYGENGEYSVFRNRTSDLAQRVQRVSLAVMVVVSGPQGVRYDYSNKTATGGWEALRFSDDELQRLVANAVALLTAQRIQPGEYDVIAAPSVTGALAHESFGHGVETDMFLKKRARAAHYIDRVVGSSLVNIWDVPSYPGAYGSYFFDDEGVPAGPTQIVENGVFRRGLTDLYSATRLSLPRSANGRRQDFTRKAYARMSNTYIAPGTTPIDTLFERVEHGMYLEKLSSGMEDPQGWGIQLTCRYGHEIKNGRLTERMFAPIGVTGYVPDVLQSVSSVGNDLEIDGGGCGKGHKEFVPVSSGGPHILFKARLG